MLDMAAVSMAATLHDVDAFYMQPSVCSLCSRSTWCHSLLDELSCSLAQNSLPLVVLRWSEMYPRTSRV